MTNPYRAFRQLERKIFRGVPEQPEPILERDNAHVPERLTGRSQLSFGLPVDATDGAEVIAVVTYRPDSGDIAYEPTARKTQSSSDL